ncbi:CRISPR-associated protein Cas5 [Butyrivibrio sp. AE3006]|uniref:CRISPR-associated protein Cas5 n=1 Tax=Butyrivibrio sp. AE3006 TaxID=1280673 RepID=UPI0004101F19|nr:CRISPR-associated protein Cas5 [Butyrivibrio sp. AE3006]
MELKLQLKGLMQSYGGENPWTATRRTNRQPTDTAIQGIVECAMGIARKGTYEEDDMKREALWNHVQIHIPDIDHAPEIIIDDQTVHPLTDDMYFQCAGGGKMSTGMPQIRKEYLVGENYTVILKGDDDYIKDIRYHLLHPIYPYSLGRACCIPSAPLVM